MRSTIGRCGAGLAAWLAYFAAAHAADGIEVRSPKLQTEAYAELAREFGRDNPLHSLARQLNARLLLPKPVGLRYAECGEVNAYYDPARREVLICFELIERLAEDFGAQLEDDLELADAVAGASTFIALHEVGHALVDVLELPITGREEDAVDQLSAWLLIGRKGGDEAVLSAAAAFSIASEGYALAQSDFADQHSLDQQRYFNMVCWVYGNDTKRHARLIEDAGLPESRAQTCAEEYARLRHSWERLMRAHLRAPAAKDEPAPKPVTP
jgi:hypothetical protein